MITAKATRQSSGPKNQSRDDFVEQDNHRRRLVPVVFLLFLAGCVAYLRSFLPIQVEARDGDKVNDANKESAEEFNREEERADADDQEDVTGSVDRKGGSSSTEAPVRISLPAEAGSVLQNDSVTPNLNGLDRTTKIYIGSNSFIESIRPAESRLAPQSSDAGRIGGGGGGGGGDDKNSSGSHLPDSRPGTPSNQIPGGTNPNHVPSGTNSNPVPGGTSSDPTRNRAPRISGAVYLQDTYGCQAFLISVLALLAGASDADGDSLHIEHVSANWGTMSQTADGNWSFTHDEGILGLVKLTYFITDGHALVPQVAYFNVVTAPPILGTSGDDNLLGAQCADTIDGGGGNDNIDAREGSDLIIGGTGDDHIVAGPGNDAVYAGAGNDVVFAGAGNDIVFGGAGDDRIYGEDGDDTLMGEDGNDLLIGGAGNDIILAGAGNDVAQGDAGNDTLDSGDGDDNLDGGEGADVLLAGSGNDIVNGGDGNDVVFDGSGRDTVDGGGGDDYLVAAADAESDIYDGGSGSDTLDYSASVSGVTVDLPRSVAFGADIGNDAVTNFERVIGGSGNDNIVAGTVSLSMDGAAGDDVLTGGAGDDVIADGAGRDTVEAGGGDDQVVATADATDDRYDGGDGVDTLSYATATLSVTVDLEHGTAHGLDVGSDLIKSFEKIVGGSGDDHLVAGSGSVSMTGGRGKDTFEFQRSDDDHEPLLIRKITDFTVGDRIVAATFEVSYLQDTDAGQEIADMFDDIYLSGSEDNRPVRFRFENLDEGEFTMVEVHDRPDTDDFFSIEVAGHHQLQFTVAVS